MRAACSTRRGPSTRKTPRCARPSAQAGAALIRDGHGVLTHCNTGGLATADYGTALSVMFTAAEQGRRFRVFADETRPLLQGARLTAWELQQAGIDVTLICDSMAAQVMKEGRIQLVIVGADRIAANGDTANKIGTYGVAVLAKAHGIPFYVAAPSSTFDLSLPNGDGIPIEQRDPREITHGFGKQTAPDGVAVYNPAFDVTPARPHRRPHHRERADSTRHRSGDPRTVGSVNASQVWEASRGELPELGMRSYQPERKQAIWSSLAALGLVVGWREVCSSCRNLHDSLSRTVDKRFQSATT